MPAALTPSERLARAESYLAQARAVVLPPAGNARGRAVVHVQSLLRHARLTVAALCSDTARIARRCTPAQREHARRILQAVADETPGPLRRR